MPCIRPPEFYESTLLLPELFYIYELSGVPVTVPSFFQFFVDAKIENQFREMIEHFEIMKPLLNLQNEIKTDHFHNNFGGGSFAGQM